MFQRLPFTLLVVILIAATAACVPSPTTPNDGAPPAAEDTPSTVPKLPDVSAPSSQDLEAVVRPGERVGPVTANTSRTDLVRLYGEDRLQDAPVPMGEGFTEPGTVVDLGPEWHFSVVWRDASQTQPLLIKDFGPGWRTPEGLGVNVPYSTVQDALGNFQLYGFAWDYGGTIVLEDSQLDRYHGQLLLRVYPSLEAMDTHADAYEAVMGDELYASTNHNFSQLDLSVYEMIVYFD
ncbi:MAG: hypothetical protein EA342_06625 [Leptolyngbya sp. LCM1.Bin17]|nr:MAG: hypothetical protein EA342_06625 [Leptolyngbya sp. LCM1.Bin17]